jgi:DNA-directed RNA polymerase beta subunit
MVRKLFSFKNGKIDADNIDTASHQEILTCGSLFSSLFQFNLNNTLYSILKTMRMKNAMYPSDVNMSSYLRTGNFICSAFTRFMSTGNLPLKINGIDCYNTFFLICLVVI